MQLSDWLKDENIDKFPILGLNSFSTFIKVCENVSKWALDDSGLANRSDSYKIWVCWQKESDLAKMISLLEKYKSMNLLLHYLRLNVVEGQQIGLYIKLDWMENSWKMSYGLTNNKKLYKIGEFIYNITIKLPESELLKYINTEIENFNPRSNYLLRQIKFDFVSFNPGYCQRQDSYVLNNQCILTCYNLGNWNQGIDNKTMLEDEANKWLEVFKQWVATKDWWNMIKLNVIVRKNKYIDFIISPK